ncbi:hypothetical protein SAMD00019534_016970 [Acytostelium subglobosum LB1]|uniref:hypothetical protein n=1 Tax=Acytostelium subglobosum LB1 TaxID=1410327 RepID=UPI000644CAEA|nr:hypothetical protein SAMD00019534_016970 [Acytostelium subglobosum LB1]GAM18522.1 hypothetical protein SAMD00019534_016970 [Acytostelium subglobosum LB1]|eukprot:XP_012757742.1 hypothetical protein SAMD00019534_016970 [Acytostelium subglobosum LB1]
MTDVQLISKFKKIEKLVYETAVYSKRVDFLKENGLSVTGSSMFDEEEELLFPLDIGNDIHHKILKVYNEYKSFIESLEK